MRLTEKNREYLNYSSVLILHKIGSGGNWRGRSANL